MADQRASRAAEKIFRDWWTNHEPKNREAIVPSLTETIQRELDREFVCKCGLRVDPHKCKIDPEF